MQLEEYLARDDRIVLPLGSTEQHAYLSLGTDSILASWLESFPWTRVEGVEVPHERKPMVDLARVRAEDPPGVRRLLGDGSYGGVYSRSDDDWRRVWQTGVEEVREVLEHGWR